MRFTVYVKGIKATKAPVKGTDADDVHPRDPQLEGPAWRHEGRRRCQVKAQLGSRQLELLREIASAKIPPAAFTSAALRRLEDLGLVSIGPSTVHPRGEVILTAAGRLAVDGGKTSA